MELLRAKVGSMQSYGINADETQLTLILLANIETAASSKSKKICLKGVIWDGEPCLPCLKSNK